MNTRYLEDEARWSDWMARSQRGDAEAYRALLGELGRVIETYLRVRFGNLQALEDCVQECLMAVHLARNTYDPRRPFRPWLFTIVRHKAIDELRECATWALLKSEDVDDAVSSAHDPEWLLRTLDGVRMLERLSPDHREMITLAKYGGYTTAEAADWLGISESAAKARLQRALGAIRKALEEEGLPA